SSFAGNAKYWRLPTLFWLNAGDSVLVWACRAGAACAVLAGIGFFPALFFFACWALYLSLVCVGGDFLSFQWDVLLLETGFLTLFLSPLDLRPNMGQEAPPAPIALWLFRWLLFRLMFMSGLVKLLSGDPVWRNLTALRYHYETQPLPTWVG